MIRQPHNRLHPRQLPAAIAALQAVKDLCPVPPIETEGKRLWAGAWGGLQAAQRIRQAGWRLLIGVREERASITVVDADQPQHKLGIVRRAEPRMLARNPYRQRFMPPIF